MTTAIGALGTFGAGEAASAPGDPVTRTDAPATTDAPGSSRAIQAAAIEHDVTTKTDQRITDLHATLKVTTAQEPQWEAVAAIMRENAKMIDQSFQSRVTGMAAMNAPDNMQSYATMSMQHALGMQKLVPAFRSLYAVLTAEQKAVADEQFVNNAHRGPDKPKG